MHQPNYFRIFWNKIKLTAFCKLDDDGICSKSIKECFASSSQVIRLSGSRCKSLQMISRQLELTSTPYGNYKQHKQTYKGYYCECVLSLWIIYHKQNDNISCLGSKSYILYCLLYMSSVFMKCVGPSVKTDKIRLGPVKCQILPVQISNIDSDFS